MHLRRSMGWLLCSGLLACQTVGSATVEAPREFEPAGGVTFFTEGAAFDEDQVVGPQVNLSRRADGSWGGVMHGQAVSLTRYGEQLRGLNTVLNVEKQGSRWVMSGQWQGEMLRFELEPTRLKVWMDRRSFTLVGNGKGDYGPSAPVKLTGEALAEEPPFPQVMLTMIATFGLPNVGQPGGVSPGGVAPGYFGANPTLTRPGVKP